MNNVSKGVNRAELEDKLKQLNKQKSKIDIEELADAAEIPEELSEEQKAIDEERQKVADEGTGAKQRGTPYMPSEAMANVVLAFGCPPTKGVLSDTRMIPDFFDALNKRYDRETLAAEFPVIFYDIQSESAPGDANWEFYTSNMLQKTKIFYENNRVTHSRALIIVNDHVKSSFASL